jgi:hypothetical protein
MQKLATVTTTIAIHPIRVSLEPAMGKAIA